MKGLVVGGVSSGVGKTVATLAVMRAFDEAGYDVQPAKAGPDFIDPSHHEVVAGVPSRTLDPWLCGTDGLHRNYRRGSGDVCVVEGMMGLYDGEVASTASVASSLGLPVVLVVDASAGMESVAATAVGFDRYAEETGQDVDVVGIVAQRAHSGRHESGIREALPDRLTYFGRIPPSSDLEIPDRHLGLHMGAESPISSNALDEAAGELDVEALLEAARKPERGIDPSPGRSDAPTRRSTEPTVAVADDRAFCFYYPATIERFRERAELVTFSPVAGDRVPDCDGVYLPGGYPERFAAELVSSGTLAELGDRARNGLPVFGECGGLVAMSRSLSTVDGDRYEMAGILPADVEMCDRYQALDHVELRAVEDAPTAGRDETVRGHEFHYSRASVDSDARFAFETVRGAGITGERDGLLAYNSIGTYAHVHPESGAFDAFLDRLAE
ncbi:cobyrinic acid a,c-diamide synthase [Halovivax gelatinilyticus]|uniref:cobyrinic acid a,c-diamide synthase n=1 Tax=Halovivax gelatinilyticus TaxID=2961597 RepID=UPI0020CA9970|nr:cobyrinic acid a,c-diamide synthase [Halovivax gelatinilyticus]